MDHGKVKGEIILRMWGRDLLYFVCLIIPRKYLAYNKHSKNICWMKMNEWTITFSSVQSLSHVHSLRPHELQHARPLCPSPLPEFTQTHVHRVSDPISHLILCHPLLLLPSNFPSIRVFLNESVLHIRWPNIGVSSSATVLPMNTQDWFPLGWTAWVSLQSKGLPKVFSNTTVQNHQFFGAQFSL